MRKKRLDLGITQKEVAKLLEATEDSIVNWERGYKMPQIYLLPKIINFIGYCPYDLEIPIAQKLVIWRSFNGLSQKRMAALLEIDPTTLAKWEQGKKKPNKNFWDLYQQILPYL